MERIYVAVTGTSVSVYHRPTHQLIGVGDCGDMSKLIKELLKKSTKDYYYWLINKCRFRVALEGKTRKDYIDNMKESEDWYKGAWKATTSNFFSKHHLKQVDEEIPSELIDQLKEDKEKRTHKQSLIDRPINDTSNDQETTTKPKKLVKVVKDLGHKRKPLVRAKDIQKADKIKKKKKLQRA